MSPKWQRAENLSEKKQLPKPVNQACERHICRTLFCRLTLELSRPVAGRRMRASVAQSTQPTPRHGVGLNELLGGGGCRCTPSPDALAENRSRKARTRIRKLSAGPVRNDSISSGHADRYQTPFPKPANVTPAMFERAKRTDRRSNAAGNRPKSNTNRSRQKEHWKAKLRRAFLPPNA